jgi:hypothetical protein
MQAKHASRIYVNGGKQVLVLQNGKVLI